MIVDTDCLSYESCVNKLVSRPSLVGTEAFSEPVQYSFSLPLGAKPVMSIVVLSAFILLL